ncbi:MAG: hypothetical protein DDT25_00152 [Chloroflexi bacterium]|nr:hypothetical protein [Chloroflexota bacterium]
MSATGSYRPASASVIDKRIDGLLKHAFLVANDDLRSAHLHEPFKPIVAVDYPSVEIIEIAGSKSSPIKLNHRPKLRGYDRKHGHNHPLRLCSLFQECFNHAKPLDSFLPMLAGSGGNLLMKLLA